MSSIENERNIKCGVCKCWRTENDFISNNRKMKSCIVCRERSKKNSKQQYQKNKEEKNQYYQENRQEINERQKKYNEENKERIAEYKKKYNEEHKQELAEYQKQYKEEHKQELAEYKKQHYQQQKKENPLHIKFKHMINGSKDNDKKHNRTYEEEEYITEDYLNELWIKQNEKCFYEDCECKLTLDFNKDFRNPTQISVQRLNNDIAHIKDNCVLSCLKCNFSKMENEKLYKKMIERVKQYQ